MLLRGLGLLLTLATRPAWAQEPGAPATGDPAPAFVIEALDGSRVDLDTLVGRRALLMEFWATWCTSCQAMLPELRRLRERFGATVEFLGINVTISDSEDAVRAYAVRERPPFVVLYDRTGEAARAYDPPATSYIVIIDATGTVVYTGLGGQQRLEAVLSRLSAPSP